MPFVMHEHTHSWHFCTDSNENKWEIKPILHVIQHSTNINLNCSEKIL